MDYGLDKLSLPYDISIRTADIAMRGLEVLGIEPRGDHFAGGSRDHPTPPPGARPLDRDGYAPRGSGCASYTRVET